MFDPCSVSGWHSRGSRGALGHFHVFFFSDVTPSAHDALHAARSPNNRVEMRILLFTETGACEIAAFSRLCMYQTQGPAYGSGTAIRVSQGHGTKKSYGY